jgi:prepilin-type N-terminal cleavage/methylation domain-containing protein
MSTLFIQKKIGKGFTLVEIMVAISIFAIVAVVAVGALLKIVDANKKAQSLETSVNNLNFIFDSMTREMRVGTNYYCTASYASFSLPLEQQGCENGISSGPWTIAFSSSRRNPASSVPCQFVYAYSYDGAQRFSKAEQTAETGCDSAPDFHPLLSNDSALDSKITFEIASVRVVQSATQQPYAQLHFKGTAGVREKTKSAFDIQTTISQRLPN